MSPGASVMQKQINMYLQLSMRTGCGGKACTTACQWRRLRVGERVSRVSGENRTDRTCAAVASSRSTYSLTHDK